MAKLRCLKHWQQQICVFIFILEMCVLHPFWFVSCAAQLVSATAVVLLTCSQVPYWDSRSISRHKHYSGPGNNCVYVFVCEGPCTPCKWMWVLFWQTNGNEQSRLNCSETNNAIIACCTVLMVLNQKKNNFLHEKQLLKNIPQWLHPLMPSVTTLTSNIVDRMVHLTNF